MRGVGLVDEQSLLPGDGMGAHDRHLGVRHLGEVFRGQHMLLHGTVAARLLFLLRLDVPAAVIDVAVHVLQPVEFAFHAVGQRIIRGRRAGEAGVAQYHAVLHGYLECVEGGQQARHLLVGEVAVPEAAGVLDPDRLAPLIENVGDDQDFGVALQPVFLAHVLLEHAEAAREGDLLFRRDLLVAEEDHFVVEESLCDPCELIVIKRL
ncbi:hypothetical protein D3C83_02710 [compost metagenome]